MDRAQAHRIYATTRRAERPPPRPDYVPLAVVVSSVAGTALLITLIVTLLLRAVPVQ
jgi:hypothetical protein